MCTGPSIDRLFQIACSDQYLVQQSVTRRLVKACTYLDFGLQDIDLWQPNRISEDYNRQLKGFGW